MDKLVLVLPKSDLGHKVSLKRLTEFDDGLDGNTGGLRDFY